MERYRVRTVPLDDPGPLLDLLPDGDAMVWLRHGDGLVGWGEFARVEAGAGPDRFRRAGRRLAAVFDRADVDDALDVPGTGPLAFGSFAFDPDSPDSVVVVPEVVVGRRGGQAWITTIGPGPHPFPPAPEPLPAMDRVRFAGSSLPDVLWLDAVAAAVRQIGDGAYEKTVLARDYAVWSKSRFDARVLLSQLADRFPGCYSFSVAGLVGATPELLAARRGDRVQSLVLAGSAGRGGDAAADEQLGEQLLASKKDRAEHEIAVASVVDGLRGCCTGLTADPAPALLRLANVQHLATNVTCMLTDPPPTALELAGLLHPTAAICGTPTNAALGAIRALEGMDRGRYSGPVGWVDARGDGDWGIALRCAQLSGARARLFAGAGIVTGSLPEAELEETRLKLNAMQSAFGA